VATDIGYMNVTPLHHYTITPLHHYTITPLHHYNIKCNFIPYYDFLHLHWYSQNTVQAALIYSSGANLANKSLRKSYSQWHSDFVELFLRG
jgi:hypothetical protein